MPTEPVQIFLVCLEFLLLLSGAILLGFFAMPAFRERWLKPNRLPSWAVTPYEFMIFVGIIFITGISLQMFLQLTVGKSIVEATDRAGLEILAYGGGLSGGCILGWLLFQGMRRRWYAEYGAMPPPDGTPARLTFAQVLRAGGATLLIALPVVTIVSLLWAFFLRRMGIPDDPQPLIAIFSETKSVWVLVGMLVVACVLAPISEELLFRGGLHRFLRQRTGRTIALLASGLLFGAVHGNWAGFLPLAVLGMILAIAYEVTGDIRVPIVTHALFNLNTVIIVLSGLPEITS
jgi:membrane protease YdiL (CAAX protease family)